MIGKQALAVEHARLKAAYDALAAERDEAVRLLREANGCLLEGTAIDGDIDAFLATQGGSDGTK
jgi:hypothetical protein